ncbi:MAG: glycosyltransferase family 39 protein [Gemmataceae bacterium]|nr:glycosyltransferase family 39 protein [Gemmataceae bacterium]
MAAAVGGRLVAVERRRSLFGPDYLRLLILAAVSVAVHGWLIAHTAVTARDGLGFARYALRLQSPEAANPPDHLRQRENPPPPVEGPRAVIMSAEHPPGYPAAVWLAGKFVRAVYPDDTLVAENYLLAAQLASGAAALLLVVPTYLLGRMLFGRGVGFLAALLVQVLPVPARLTSDALTEGTYLLAVSTAVLLGARALRRPGVGGFLLCGLAVGGAYLVRLEGLMVAAAVGLVGGWLGLTGRWPRDLTAGRLVALAVGVGLVAGPYVIMIGKLTNKPTPTEMLKPFRTPGEILRGGKADAAVGGPLFAKSWPVPEGAGLVGLAKPAARAAAEEAVKGLHYLAAGLAVIGVIAVRRRVAADPGVALLVVLAGVNFVVLVGLGARGYAVNQDRFHYVSERHTLLLVLIGCVFAAAGVQRLAGWSRARGGAARYAPAAVAAVLVATALPSTLKPLHANREGHKHAGRWLLANTDRDKDCVIDPFEWAAFYGWRTLYFIPADPPDPEVTYAVVDDKEHDGDHARLPRMKDARAVKEDGRSVVVYHWPEDVPVEQAKVKVYKLVRPK